MGRGPLPKPSHVGYPAATRIPRLLGEFARGGCNFILAGCFSASRPVVDAAAADAAAAAALTAKHAAKHRAALGNFK